MAQSEAPISPTGETKVVCPLKFALLFRNRKALLVLQNTTPCPGFSILNYEAELIDVRLPLEGRLNSERFRHRRSFALTATLEFSREFIQEQLNTRLLGQTVAGYKISNVLVDVRRTHSSQQPLSLYLYFSANHSSDEPLSWMINLELQAKHCLLNLVPRSVWFVGDRLAHEENIIHQLADQFRDKLNGHSSSGWNIHIPFATLVRPITRYGWKAPDIRCLNIDTVEIHHDSIRLQLNRSSEPNKAEIVEPSQQQEQLPTWPDDLFSTSFRALDPKYADSFPTPNPNILSLNELLDELTDFPKLQYDILQWQTRLSQNFGHERRTKTCKLWLRQSPENNLAKRHLSLAFANQKNFSSLLEHINTNHESISPTAVNCEYAIASISIQIELGEPSGHSIQPLTELLEEIKTDPDRKQIYRDGLVCLTLLRISCTPVPLSPFQLSSFALEPLNQAIAITKSKSRRSDLQRHVARYCRKQQLHAMEEHLLYQAWEHAPGEEEILRRLIELSEETQNYTSLAELLRQQSIRNTTNHKNRDYFRERQIATFVLSDKTELQLEARNLLDSNLKQNPGDIESLIWLASLDYRLNNWRQAASNIDKILDFYLTDSSHDSIAKYEATLQFALQCRFSDLPLIGARMLYQAGEFEKSWVNLSRLKVSELSSDTANDCFDLVVSLSKRFAERGKCTSFVESLLARLEKSHRFHAHLFCADESAKIDDKIHHFISASHLDQLSRRQIESLLNDAEHAIDPDHLALVGELAESSGLEDFAASLHYRSAQRLAQQERHHQAIKAFERSSNYFASSLEFSWDFANSLVAVGETQQAIQKLEVIMLSIAQGRSIESGRGLAIVQLLIELSDWSRADQLLQQLEETSQAPTGGAPLEIFLDCQYHAWRHINPHQALELVANQLERRDSAENSIWSDRIVELQCLPISTSDWFELFLRIPWHQGVAQFVYERICSNDDLSLMESFVRCRIKHSEDSQEIYRLLDELTTRLKTGIGTENSNEKLIEWYRLMIEISPQDCATRHRLAQTFLSLDDLETAYQQWNSFASDLCHDDPLYLEVWTEIIRCAMICREWDHAKKGLETAFRYQGNSDHLAQMQLELAEHSEDQALACSALEKLLDTQSHSPERLQWRRYLAELQHTATRYDDAFTQLDLLIKDKGTSKKEILSALRLWITWSQEIQDENSEAKARFQMRCELGNELPVEDRVAELSLMIKTNQSSCAILEHFRLDADLILNSPSNPDTQTLLRKLANIAQKSKSIETLKRIIDAVESRGSTDQELVSWNDYYLSNSGHNQSLIEEIDSSLQVGPIDSFAIQRLHHAHGSDYSATLRHMIELVDQKWSLDIVDLCAAAIQLLPKVETLATQATLSAEILLRIEAVTINLPVRSPFESSRLTRESEQTQDKESGQTKDTEEIRLRTQALKEQCWNHLENCFAEVEGRCEDPGILEPAILISFPNFPPHLPRIFSQIILSSRDKASTYSSLMKITSDPSENSRREKLSEIVVSLLRSALSLCLENQFFNVNHLAYAYAQFAKLLPSNQAASWILSSEHFPIFHKDKNFSLLHNLRELRMWKVLLEVAESDQHLHQTHPEFWLSIAQWAQIDGQTTWESKARIHAGTRLIHANALPTAVDQLERALELYPTQPKARLQLAQVCEQLRQLDRALYHYLYLYQREEWQNAEIEHGLLAYACGRLTGIFGQTEQSLIFLQVAHDCVDQENRNQIAEQLYASYISLSKRNAALELANISVGETQDSEQRTLWLLRAADCVEGWERVEQLQVAVDINPHASDLCDELVRTMIATNDAPATIEVVAQRLKQCTSIQQAQPYFATLTPEFLRQCSPDSVAKVWKEILDLDPSHFRSLINLGQYYYDRDQVDKAESLWSQAILVASTDDESLENPLRTLANLCDERGQKKESVELLEQLLVLSPDDEPALRKILKISIEQSDLQRILSYSELLIPFSQDLNEKLEFILHCIRSQIYLQHWSSVLDLLHSTTQIVKPTSTIHLELAQLWMLVAATCPDGAGQIEIQARTQLGQAYAKNLPIELLLQEIEVLERHGLATKGIDRLALFLEDDPSNLLLSSAIVSLARKHGLENKLAIVLLRLIETMEAGEIRDHYLLELLPLAQSSNFPQIVQTAISALSSVAQQRVPVHSRQQWIDTQKLRNSEAIPITVELLLSSMDSNIPYETNWETFGLQIFERFERNMENYLSFMLQRIEGIDPERSGLILQHIIAIIAEHDNTNYPAAFTILQTAIAHGLPPSAHWYTLIESIIQSNDLVTFLSLIEVLGKVGQDRNSAYFPLFDALSARGLHLYPNEIAIFETFSRYYIGSKSTSIINIQPAIEEFSIRHRLDILSRANLFLICGARLTNDDIHTICVQLVERWPQHRQVVSRCSQELLKRNSWPELIQLYRLAQIEAELWQDTADYLSTRNEFEYQAQCRLESAQCFARHLDFSSSEKEFTRALELAPDNFAVRRAYGVALMEQHKYEEALHQLIPLVREESRNQHQSQLAELAFRCGQAAYHLSDHHDHHDTRALEYSTTAQEMLQLAIDSAETDSSIKTRASELLYPLLAQNSPEKAYALAWSNAQHCSFADRRLWLHRAASTAPEHARSQVLIECLRLNPKDQDLVHSALAQCHQTQENSQIDAIYEFLIANSNLLETKHSQIVRLHMERIAIHSGSDDRRLAPQLEALLRIAPDNIDARISLARLRERNRDRLGSVRHWKMALPALSPDDPRKEEALLAIVRDAIARDSKDSVIKAWLEWSKLSETCVHNVFDLFYQTLNKWKQGQNQLCGVFEKIIAIGPQLHSEPDFHVCTAQFWHHQGNLEKTIQSLQNASRKIPPHSSQFQTLKNIWASACHQSIHFESKCKIETHQALLALRSEYSTPSSLFLTMIEARQLADEFSTLQSILATWQAYPSSWVLQLISRASCIRFQQPVAFMQALQHITQRNLRDKIHQRLIMELVHQAKIHGDASRCLQALDRLQDPEQEPRGYRQWCLVSLKKAKDQTELICRQLLDEPNINKVRDLIAVSDVDLASTIQKICEQVLPKSGSKAPIVLSVVLEVLADNEDHSQHIDLAMKLLSHYENLDGFDSIEHWWSRIDKNTVSLLPPTDLQRLSSFFLRLANKGMDTNTNIARSARLIGQLFFSSLKPALHPDETIDPLKLILELCETSCRYRSTSEALASMLGYINKWLDAYPLVGSHRVVLYSMISKFKKFDPAMIAPTLFEHALVWNHDLGAVKSAFQLLDEWNQLEFCCRLVLEHQMFREEIQLLQYLVQRQNENDDPSGQSRTLQALAERHLQLNQFEECQLANRKVANFGFMDAILWVKVQYALAKQIETQQSLMFAVDVYFDLFLIPPTNKNCFAETNLDPDRKPGEYFATSQRVAAKLLELSQPAKAIAILRRAYDILHASPSLKVKIAEQLYQLLRSSTDRPEKQSLVEFALLHTKDKTRIPWLLRSYRISDPDLLQNSKALSEAWSIAPTDATVIETYEQFLESHGDIQSFSAFVLQRFEQLAFSGREHTFTLERLASKFHDFLNQAKVRTQEGEHPELRVLEFIVQVLPTHAPSVHRLSTYYEDQGLFAQSIAILEPLCRSTLVQNNERVSSYLRVAKLALKSHQSTRAISAIEQGLSLDPRNIDLLITLLDLLDFKQHPHRANSTIQLLLPLLLAHPHRLNIASTILAKAWNSRNVRIVQSIIFSVRDWSQIDPVFRSKFLLEWIHQALQARSNEPSPSENYAWAILESQARAEYRRNLGYGCPLDEILSEVDLALAPLENTQLAAFVFAQALEIGQPSMEIVIQYREKFSRVGGQRQYMNCIADQVRSTKNHYRRDQLAQLWASIAMELKLDQQISQAASFFSIHISNSSEIAEFRRWIQTSSESLPPARPTAEPPADPLRDQVSKFVQHGSRYGDRSTLSTAADFLKKLSNESFDEWKTQIADLLGLMRQLLPNYGPLDFNFRETVRVIFSEHWNEPVLYHGWAGDQFQDQDDWFDELQALIDPEGLELALLYEGAAYCLEGQARVQWLAKQSRNLLNDHIAFAKVMDAIVSQSNREIAIELWQHRSISTQDEQQRNLSNIAIIELCGQSSQHLELLEETLNSLQIPIACDHDIAIFLSDCYLALLRFDQAKKILEQHPSSSSSFNDRLQQINYHDKSPHRQQELLASLSNHHHYAIQILASKSRAKLLLESGDTTTAIEIYQHLLEQFPNLRDIWSQLTDLLAKSSRWKQLAELRDRYKVHLSGMERIRNLFELSQIFQQQLQDQDPDQSHVELQLRNALAEAQLLHPRSELYTNIVSNLVDLLIQQQRETELIDEFYYVFANFLEQPNKLSPSELELARKLGRVLISKDEYKSRSIELFLAIESSGTRCPEALEAIRQYLLHRCEYSRLYRILSDHASEDSDGEARTEHSERYISIQMERAELLEKHLQQSKLAARLYLDLFVQNSDDHHEVGQRLRLILGDREGITFLQNLLDHESSRYDAPSLARLHYILGDLIEHHTMNVNDARFHYHHALSLDSNCSLAAVALQQKEKTVQSTPLHNTPLNELNELNRSNVSDSNQKNPTLPKKSLSLSPKKAVIPSLRQKPNTTISTTPLDSTSIAKDIESAIKRRAWQEVGQLAKQLHLQPVSSTASSTTGSTTGSTTESTRPHPILLSTLVIESMLSQQVPPLKLLPEDYSLEDRKQYLYPQIEAGLDSFVMSPEDIDKIDRLFLMLANIVPDPSQRFSEFIHYVGLGDASIGRTMARSLAFSGLDRPIQATLCRQLVAFLNDSQNRDGDHRSVHVLLQSAKSAPFVESIHAPTEIIAVLRYGMTQLREVLSGHTHASPPQKGTSKGTLSSEHQYAIRRAAKIIQPWRQQFELPLPINITNPPYDESFRIRNYFEPMIMIPGNIAEYRNEEVEFYLAKATVQIVSGFAVIIDPQGLAAESLFEILLSVFDPHSLLKKKWDLIHRPLEQHLLHSLHLRGRPIFESWPISIQRQFLGALRHLTQVWRTSGDASSDRWMQQLHRASDKWATRLCGRLDGALFAMARTRKLEHVAGSLRHQAIISQESTIYLFRGLGLFGDA